jgi:hypothetical protein
MRLQGAPMTDERATAKGATARWFSETSDQIQKDYDRLFSAARNDPQKSGHEAESAWHSILKKWLPDYYEIGSRKYILPDVESDQRDCFETDLVIFNPAYPKPLREKSEILSGGILAAFFVRLTLDADGIRDACRRASILKRSSTVRVSTPRMHLHGPFSVGLLAHSHSWKASGSTPFDNVDRNLKSRNLEYATEPRELLDYACVADLAFWTTTHRIQVGPGVFLPHGMTPSQKQDGAISVRTNSAGPSTDMYPVARLMMQIIYRLGYVDPTLRHWSLGLHAAMPALAANQHAEWRHWNLQGVLPTSLILAIRQRGFDSLSPQNDWQQEFL